MLSPSVKMPIHNNNETSTVMFFRFDWEFSCSCVGNTAKSVFIFIRDQLTDIVL